MKTAFWAECRKAHRRHELLLCLLLPCIVLLWMGRLGPADADELANGYSAMLYSLPVIDTILLPVMMAVLASCLWEMEVKGEMPKLLCTLQSRADLFRGKLAFGGLELALTTMLELAVLPLLGRVQGYTEAFPAEQFAYLALCKLAVEAMLFLASFWLTLQFASPMAALGSSIVGTLLGLFSAFLPPIVSYFVPWGYLIPLGCYEVARWDQDTHFVLYGTRGYNWGLLAFVVVLAAGFLWAAWHALNKKEV